MKKLLSIFIAAIMAVSMCAISALPAIAAPTVNSPVAPTLKDDSVITKVNGDNSQDITYKPSGTNANEITFTYDGEGDLTGWEDNLEALGLVAGTDYTAVKNSDGSYTITFITTKAIDAWNAGSVVVNALVDFEDDVTVEDVDDETTKKNSSSKSPKTGISSAAVAGSIALAGAGIAVVAAAKKKDAE
ncbi:MAG: hypothetical protein ACI4RR_04405 [Eubacterium sp.]